MCLIFIAHRAHPRFPLLVAANRDEFHSRPTAPVAVWPGEQGLSEIVAGRDLEAGGTWMGVTRCGRFAALTNYRDPASGRKNPPSRGGLVSGFLTASLSGAEYIERLRQEGHRYNGFSLLVHDAEELYCYSNRLHQVTRIEPGVHGLSNHLLNSPWPKVTRGVAAVTGYLAEHADLYPLTDSLFDMLTDRLVPEDGDLPSTGVGLERERELAPMFVHGDAYGTQSSTVLLVEETGSIRIEERSYDAEAQEVGRVVEQWVRASPERI